MRMGAGIRCSFDDTARFMKGTVARLFGEDAVKVFEGFSLLVCRGEFAEAYLLRGEVVDLVKGLLGSGRVPYAAGLYAGRLRRSRPTFVPSVDFLSFLYSGLGSLRRALIVGERGLKPFLYGKDVLRASVLKCFEPLSKGEVVGVVGEDGFVYGVGLSVIDSCREVEGLGSVDVVAENVFDVGWYLRGGTEARERKFKI